MTRTFSKIYGLAGLRVGWAYCPAGVADALNRVRGPFNVSIPAQRAAAAALRDRAHVEAGFAHNEKWKAWVTEEIRKLGFAVDDSVGNFILINFSRDKGKTLWTPIISSQRGASSCAAWRPMACRMPCA